MAYRMDAILDPGPVLTWPVNDVLLPENISANRIGVFGWKETGQTKTYVPVRVSASRPAAPGVRGFGAAHHTALL